MTLFKQAEPRTNCRTSRRASHSRLRFQPDSAPAGGRARDLRTSPRQSPPPATPGAVAGSSSFLKRRCVTRYRRPPRPTDPSSGQGPRHEPVVREQGRRRATRDRDEQHDRGGRCHFPRYSASMLMRSCVHAFMRSCVPLSRSRSSC